MSDDDEIYGIDEANGHPRALELISDDFFWNCADELGPFGSDEGDTALDEYRQWRKENPKAPLLKCVTWVIEELSEQSIDRYTDEIITESYIRKQLEDPDFDDEYYIYSVDISIIATGFGQLADEGAMDEDVKPYIDRALKRQLTFSMITNGSDEYKNNMRRLQEVLAEA